MGRNIFFESGKWRFAVNIADKYLEINGLIKEKGENYHPIIKAKIPLENKVEEFVHALLVLRNNKKKYIYRGQGPELECAFREELERIVYEKNNEFKRENLAKETELIARIVKLKQFAKESAENMKLRNVLES
ncbi:hypothetical protein C2G38_2250741 [Gigaspora rosea]|uniref:Uncharacterized protein n=1 Tax=Gigaspora rosea TaxID=44941 RepID=A0A397UMU6_9GLOM|nr:hypothetical protein C2G38_2250741 [Gigaspora rosea]